MGGPGYTVWYTGIPNARERSSPGTTLISPQSLDLPEPNLFGLGGASFPGSENGERQGLSILCSILLLPTLYCYFVSQLNYRLNYGV